MPAYVAEKLDDVRLECGDPLKSMDWMSPFVWRDGDRLRMLMRGVPDPMGPSDPTGVIFAGESSDGLSFKMDQKPAIMHGTEEVDAGGVEDPTVLATDDGLLVYFTGVKADRSQGSMLVATGKTMDGLIKKAVVLEAPEGEGNIKEATLAQCQDGTWRLFYEYAVDNASRIGLATSANPGGPWVSIPDLFTIREEAWDNWHLSTGPIVQLDGCDPVMFYNGATADARWRIGWISFDPGYTRVTGRCVEPVIVPPPAIDRADTDIAFAASALVTGKDSLDLYYSVEDRRLARASFRAYWSSEESSRR